MRRSNHRAQMVRDSDGDTESDSESESLLDTDSGGKLRRKFDTCAA